MTVDLSNAITMDRDTAEAAMAELAAHPKQLTDEERMFLDGYRALAGGATILDLRAAIAAGGCFDDEYALPRLAVARPQDHWIHVDRGTHGGVSFGTQAGIQGWGRGSRWAINFASGLLPPCERPSYGSKRAMVPPVPIGVRVRLGRPGGGGWRKCLVLFEVPGWAEAPPPPGDPALLRHLTGDLYVVEAVWDLTALEQAVLAGARADG